MANIRIIYNNLADSASSVIASTTMGAGNLDASNMLNDYKGKIHRSTGTSVTYTITWGSSVSVGGVALPATNLTSSATIRVTLFSGLTQVADSGTIYACPGTQLGLWNWSNPINANAFLYGGASKTAVWFSSHYSVTKVVINLVDSTNPAGYIDCSRLVVGPYWEPQYNVTNGIVSTLNDLSSSTRNESGDLVPDRSIIHDQLSFDFSVLLDTDRLLLTQLLKKTGVSSNLLVSVFPDNNSTLEQMHIIYGKRSNSSINLERYGIYKHSMDIEGW